MSVKVLSLPYSLLQLICPPNNSASFRVRHNSNPLPSYRRELSFPVESLKWSGLILGYTIPIRVSECVHPTCRNNHQPMHP
jgi:hypothetical protein